MRAQEFCKGRPDGAGHADAAPDDALPVPLFESEPVADLVTDPAGVIRSVSPAAGVLLRAAPGYLEGVPLVALVLRADRSRFLALLGSPEAGWARDGATVHLAVPGGLPVVAEMSLAVTRDAAGFVAGLRWQVRDQRPRPGAAASDAEAALRRRLGRLAAAGHGICLLRADGIVTWIGAAALEMLGWQLGHVVGHHWADLVSEAEGDDPSPLQLALRRGRQGSGRFHGVARGNGTVTALDYFVLPLIEDERVLGAALAFIEAGVR